MTPEHARVMARYNRWMNDKLYAVAEKLTDEERKKDRGAFFGSIHRTLNHLLVADRIWLGRFTGAALAEGEMGPGGIRSLDQELYADFDELRRERRQDAERRAMQIPVKVIFPLLLFIIPAMFIVVIGPGVIQAARAFGVDI